MKRWVSTSVGLGILVALNVLLRTEKAQALSDDFTFGDFENFKYVDINTNQTAPAGVINNGIGRTDFGLGNSDVIHSTGWHDMATPGYAVFSNSTTTGVTTGTTAIRMNPNFFGQGVSQGNFSEHLSLLIQDIGLPPTGGGIIPYVPDDPTLATATMNNFLTHKYFAIDVTFKSSEWTHGAFANSGAAGTSKAPGALQIMAFTNEGGPGTTTPLVDRFGFHPLGQYVQNFSNPDVAIPRPPDVDSRQALLGGTGGVYDPGNHPGSTVYTTTLYYDYSHWQSSPTSSDGGAGSGGPPTGVYFDERSFSTNPAIVSARNGYLEFVFATVYDIGYTGGAIYFDNARFTNEVLRLGDFNNDGHVDASDIVAAEAALANNGGYESTPTGLPAGVTLSAQDLLTIGDINGDGKFTAADLQMLLVDLSNGHGSVTPVPEPAAIQLAICTGLLFGFSGRIRGMLMRHPKK